VTVATVTIQSLQKNAAFFCDCSGQKSAALFLKKCDEICGIFMQFYAMKLRELAKIAGTFPQRKCGDYEIMQAPHILRGNLQFMW
jgi:hypothetical protein